MSSSTGMWREARVGLHRLAHVVAALARHHDVGEHDVGPDLARTRDRVVAVVHGHDANVLVGEADPDDLLDRDAVVGEQQGLGHVSPRAAEQSRACRPRAGAFRLVIVAAVRRRLNRLSSAARGRLAGAPACRRRRSSSRGPRRPMHRRDGALCGPGEAMILRTAAHTDVGLRRTANEDRFALAPAARPLPGRRRHGRAHAPGRSRAQLAAEAGRGARCATREGAAASLDREAALRVAAANRAIYSRPRAASPSSRAWAPPLVALLAGGGRARARARRRQPRLPRARRADPPAHRRPLDRRRSCCAAARSPPTTRAEHPHRHVLTRALGVRRRVEPDLAELTPAPGRRVRALLGRAHQPRRGPRDREARVASGATSRTACERLIDARQRARRRGQHHRRARALRRERSRSSARCGAASRTRAHAADAACGPREPRGTARRPARLRTRRREPLDAARLSARACS